MITVKLDFKSDEDLRNYIKNLIKGQVESIGRKEIADMMKKTIEHKTRHSSQNDTDDFIGNLIKETTEKFIFRTLDTERYGAANVARLFASEMNKKIDKFFEDNFEIIMKRLEGNIIENFTKNFSERYLKDKEINDEEKN